MLVPRCEVRKKHKLPDWPQSMHQIGLELRKVSPPEPLPSRVRSLLVRLERERKCARCGAGMIAPVWSEHLSDRRVQNVWSGDACGYQFEDTVLFPARLLIGTDESFSQGGPNEQSLTGRIGDD